MSGDEGGAEGGGEHQDAVSSGSVCFLGSAKVKTYQGLIAFNELTKYYTIDNQKSD